VNGSDTSWIFSWIGGEGSPSGVTVGAGSDARLLEKRKKKKKKRKERKRKMFDSVFQMLLKTVESIENPSVKRLSKNRIFLKLSRV
jgi:hypothetical protein